MVNADGGVDHLLQTIAEQATAEAHGAAPVRHQWIPDTLAEAEAAAITDIDLLQAVIYYRTERGHHPNSTNHRHYLSDALILADSPAWHRLRSPFWRSPALGTTRCTMCQSTSIRQWTDSKSSLSVTWRYCRISLPPPCWTSVLGQAAADAFAFTPPADNP